MASVERGESTQTSTREHPDDERPFELPGEDGSAERPGEGRPPRRRREQAIGARISDPQIQRWMIRVGAAAVLGLLFANYPPLIEGPFRNAAGGVDLSLLVAIGVAAVAYVALIVIFPEPRYVFGPEGPRGVPAGDAPMPAVVDDHKASVHRANRRTTPAED
jgi:hypothetical protein